MRFRVSVLTAIHLAFVLAATPSFLSFAAEAGAPLSCIDAYKFQEARSTASAASGRNFTYQEYLARSLQSGPHRLDPKWLEAVQAILETNSEEFIRLIPKRFFPKADRRRKIQFSTPDKVRYFEAATAKYTAPSFFHQTEVTSAREILKDGLAVSDGAHTEGAICLGDGGFRHFQRKYSKAENTTLLQVTLSPKARILDLTQAPFGERGATEGSYYAAFDWYQDVFLVQLRKGLYKDKFPELTRIIQSSPYVGPLESKEAFGLLVKADAIAVSEKYGGGISLNEYWVLNPKVIQTVEYHAGAIP